MLDLTKLAQQLQGISHHLTAEASAAQLRLKAAQALLAKVQQDPAEWIQRRQTWRDRLCFTAAEPVEPLHRRPAIVAPPAAHTVLATDGSQIAPSHHEIAYCYLINVGCIILHYGQNRQPMLESWPEVFYRPEDLYLSRQWGIRTEEWMVYRRTVSEAVVLAELGQQVATDGGQPTLAMVDGSLIYWFLDQLPGEARDRILHPILAAWTQLRQAQIPLVGYLSASRSGESLNFMRLAACPYASPDCGTHCSDRAIGEMATPQTQAPCQVFEPLKDVTLWASQLEPGQRSPLWRSSAPILALYGEQSIYFCYVHVGTEVARVEMPAWVAENEGLREQALSLTIAQVQKGFGYPVVLAEAHNQAVVRGGDRTRFFAFLEQEMLRAGLQNVGISYKEARKRGSIA